MAINITSKEMPTGGCNPTANAINKSNLPKAERSGKAFETLRAPLALRGYVVHRIDSLGWPVTYWPEGYGLVRYSSTLHCYVLFFAQIGGQV